MFTGNTGRIQLIGPVLSAMLMIGCAGRTAALTRGVLSSRKPARPDAPAQATVSISGCVEAAPGPRQYVLRHVRFEPRETGDPHIDTNHGGRPRNHRRCLGPAPRRQGGPRAARRQAGDDSWSDHRQRPEHHWDGRHRGVQTPSGDTSQAASSKHHSEKVKTEAGRIARESMADGTAAEVAVQKVQTSGDKCPLEVQPEGR